MNARLVLVPVLLAIAACSPSVGNAGPVVTPNPAAEPSLGQPTPDVTPAASPSPGPASPGGDRSPAPSPSPGAGRTIVRAYFFLPTSDGDPRLVPVLREVPRTAGVARAAIEGLIAGPSPRETSASITTAVPEGTRLLGISIADGIATIDLSREFEAGGGSAGAIGRLAQVVYTLTQFPTVGRVRFEIDGAPITAFGSHGILIERPVGRDDYLDNLPEIFVDRPAWGAALGDGRVTGLTRVFEASFRVQLIGSDGVVAADLPVMATCGSGCWGTFEVTLPHPTSATGWGTLRVWNGSAMDGRPENVRDYPVWITAD